MSAHQGTFLGREVLSQRRSSEKCLQHIWFVDLQGRLLELSKGPEQVVAKLGFKYMRDKLKMRSHRA